MLEESCYFTLKQIKITLLIDRSVDFGDLILVCGWLSES